MVQSAKSRNHEADLTVGRHFAKLTLQALSFNVSILSSNTFLPESCDTLMTFTKSALLVN